MRPFVVLVFALCVTGMAQASSLASRKTGLTWNSFLGAGSIFAEEVDGAIELDMENKDDLNTLNHVLNQLNAVLDRPGVLAQTYNNFLAQTGNVRAASELKSRMAVFRQRLMTIATHNVEARAGKHTWTKAVTKFCDWTQEERSSFLPSASSTNFGNLTGISPPTEISQEKLALYKALVANAPSSKDYRDDGVVSPVKDQGLGCEGGGGSCYAFAATGVAESAYAIKTGQMLDLSEYEIVTCGNGEPGISGCDGGDMYFTLLWMKNGLALESDMPKYEGTHANSMTCPADAKSKTHYAKVLDIVYNPEGTEDDLLGMLLAYGPVGVSVAVDDGRGWFDYGPTSGIYDGACGSGTNHAVNIVGYTPDAWILKNSWGISSWGIDGYMLIRRGVNKCMVGTRLRSISAIA